MDIKVDRSTIIVNGESDLVMERKTTHHIAAMVIFSLFYGLIHNWLVGGVAANNIEAIVAVSMGGALVILAITTVVFGFLSGLYWLAKRKYIPNINTTLWVVWSFTIMLNLIGTLLADEEKGETSVTECMTDKDFKSEVATGFLVGTSAKAFKCDRQYPASNLENKGGRMKYTAAILEKHEKKWRTYAGWREEYFQRKFGQNWKYKMEENQKQMARLIFSQLVVNQDLCDNFTNELIHRTERDWDYIKSQLDVAMSVSRASVVFCKAD